ncbi:molybdopterin cofactor-binding domain-containing protein [Hansschlegelia quercus]|uniref:Xanthine dehydrogenase family protein molybdopterin-binding subunit n=1 Tax=Hansschlegelia quercus TaxID=2528245 RepID=A0A4Q9GQ40_9HYPH|nr:xanthine dehydrogenase family protein molybdopterin-binding subunit [Hansschlegelia quercus]TBN53757.1 xanthine dehydrogenase family protein molybdopterin-binding subunit [Hansschlegelia quercus]
MSVLDRIRGDKPTDMNRRGFLAIAGGAGVGLMVGLKPFAAEAEAAAGGIVQFNPFVKVSPDGAITVVVKHLDMGQGPTTGLATLIAEEMDADWSQMRTEFAPADNVVYANLAFKAQGTGGSTAMANSWEQYRTAGAAARAVLVKAAADKWQVSQGEITVAKGVLTHPSGKRGTYGEFAEAASKIPPPTGMAQETPYKEPEKFKLIGKEGFHRIDNDPKTDGTAIYTQDVKLPGMLVAVVAHPPRFGGKVKSFDDAEAKKVKGVERVVQIPQGVAVLAKNTFAAIKGRNALKVEWDDSAAEMRGSEELLKMAKEAVSKPGVATATNKGDAEGALAGAAKVIEAEYTFPYLAHAPMEPLNCVVDLKKDGARLIYGAQFQGIDQPTVAALTGLRPDQVKIETVWAGGSFGRRAVPTADYVTEAVMIAKAIDGANPVKLVWTREDDTKGGYYRPFYAHKVRAAIGADGMPVAWSHRIAGQSIFAGTALEAMAVKDGVDDTSVEGASNLAYAVPNLKVELTTLKVGVPVLWWRSVGHTHTAHVVETMIDELAHAAGKDPVEYRLALLKDKPRHTAALKLVAEKAGWGGKLEKGKGRGVAVHESFKSVVAQVVEVTIQKDGGVKVDRVVAAVDCGTVINPDVVRAQVEGGVGFGLGAALRNAITLDGGVVQEANFDSYEPLRMGDMPKVEVYTVVSQQPPTGIGEPGVPPLAPALANAIFSATGKRLRDLPLGDQKFTIA